MPSYLVTWKIEVDAETPAEAAKLALEIQRDPASTATVFEVRPEQAPEGPATIVDVANLEQRGRLVGHGAEASADHRFTSPGCDLCYEARYGHPRRPESVDPGDDEDATWFRNWERILCDEYAAWGRANGIADDDLRSADEQVLDETMSPEQRQWLTDFVLRWDAAVERDHKMRDEEPGSRCGPGCGYCGRCS